MQYLLTQKEYDILHGEGDDESEALEIENMKLKVTMTTFIDKIDEVQVFKNHEFGMDNMVAISIKQSDIPQEVMQILENRYRGHPQDPFRSH